MRATPPPRGGIQQVYVAGSYTAPSHGKVRENIATALYAGLRLTKAGYNVLIPHVAVGHRSEWAPAMDRCADLFATLVPGRDMVVLLPGWESSKGARIERSWAEQKGIDVRELHELFPAAEVEGVPA